MLAVSNTRSAPRSDSSSACRRPVTAGTCRSRSKSTRCSQSTPMTPGAGVVATGNSGELVLSAHCSWDRLVSRSEAKTDPTEQTHSPGHSGCGTHFRGPGIDKGLDALGPVYPPSVARPLGHQQRRGAGLRERHRTNLRGVTPHEPGSVGEIGARTHARWFPPADSSRRVNERTSTGTGSVHQDRSATTRPLGSTTSSAAWSAIPEGPRSPRRPQRRRLHLGSSVTCDGKGFDVPVDGDVFGAAPSASGDVAAAADARSAATHPQTRSRTAA